MAKNKNSGKIKSQIFFNALVENLSDFIVVISADGIIKYASPSFYRMLGYSHTETIGKSAFTFLHPDDLPKAKEDYKALLANPEILQQVNLRLLNKNGSIHYVNGNRKNLLSDPEVDGIVLSVRDITDITISNILLNEKNEMLEVRQRLLNVTELISKVGGWEYDVITQKMFWTEETYRIHEINKNEIDAGSTSHINRSLECYPPEDRQKILEAFNNCINNAEPYDLVSSFITCKGKNLWVRTIAKPIIENN
ncbi:MAG: PAS domain S-box protein, partial [Ignavibacteriales bacterium]